MSNTHKFEYRVKSLWSQTCCSDNFLLTDVKNEPDPIEYKDVCAGVKLESSQEYYDDESLSIKPGPNRFFGDAKIEIEDTVVQNTVKSEELNSKNANIDRNSKAPCSRYKSSAKSKLLKYTCEQCGYKTNLKTTYHNHLTTHSDDRPYTCDRCRKSFKRKDAIIDHLETHKTKTNSRSSKSFERKDASPQLKRYKCAKCTYATNAWSSYDRHLTTHTSERPCVCLECGKAYKHRTSLALHMKLHSNKHLKGLADGEDALHMLHQCAVCGYKTHYKCDLSKHVKLHSDERPFVCEKCSRGFKRKHYLAEHLKRLVCCKTRRRCRMQYTSIFKIGNRIDQSQIGTESPTPSKSTLTEDCIKNEIDVHVGIPRTAVIS